MRNRLVVLLCTIASIVCVTSPGWTLEEASGVALTVRPDQAKGAADAVAVSPEVMPTPPRSDLGSVELTAPTAMPAAPLEIEEARLIPFPAGVSLPMSIGVAMFVEGIGRINEVGQTFVGEIDLRYSWRDPRLAFDVESMATDRLEYGNERAFAKLKTIWNPQIAITNMVSTGADIAPGLFIHPDGSVEFIQRIKATFETRFALDAFPFDSQILPVVMLSSKYNVEELAMVQDQHDVHASGMKKGMKVRGWQPQGITFVMSRQRAWNGSLVSNVEARVGIKRQYRALFGAIFTPFLLALLVPTIITFFTKPDAGSRLMAWGASILALVALSFTFAVRFPAQDGVSLIAQVVRTGQVYQMVCVLLSITLLNPAFTDRFCSKFVLAELLDYLRWSVPLGLVCVLCAESLLTAYAW